MASDYRVADGFDVALVSLTVLNPQPKSNGVQFTSRSFAADGTPTNQGPFIELVWTALSNANYDTIMTAFGLTSAYHNDVTIYARDENWDYSRFNGKAIKPNIGEDRDWDIFPRDMRILIRNLEALSEPEVIMGDNWLTEGGDNWLTEGGDNWLTEG